MAGTDYYKLLGVDRNADDDAIKKAYKKMALKWHPDRNAGSEEANKKFKAISEAFEVLSDKNKRSVYDQFGEDGLKGHGPMPPGPDFGGEGGMPGGSPFGGGFPGGATFSFSSSGPRGAGGFTPSDPSFIFEQFFKSMGGGGGGFSSSFMDVDDHPGSPFSSGASPFGGGGASPFASFGRMGGAGGSMPGRAGSSSPRRQSTSSSTARASAEIVRPLKLTLEELYTGTTKKLKIGRKLLSGQQDERVVEVNVLPGWKAGTKAKFDNAGNENDDGSFQTVAFVVEEKSHDRFTRDGDDLIAKVKIPLVDALCGISGKPPTVLGIDGKRTHNVPLPAGGAVIKPKTQVRIRGEGMPKRKEGKVVGKGDLVVEWDIVFPDRLGPGQKEAIRRGLGS